MARPPTAGAATYVQPSTGRTARIDTTESTTKIYDSISGDQYKYGTHSIRMYEYTDYKENDDYDHTQVFYCIEYGVSVASSEQFRAYATDHSSRNGLTEAVKRSLKLVMGFGLSYRNAAALKRLNAASYDDAFAATQVLVWEFQQGCRTSLTGNAADTTLYKGFIKGTGAQTVYWRILELANAYLTDTRYSAYKLDTTEDFLIWQNTSDSTAQFLMGYHDPEGIFYQFGTIKIYKKDPNGAPLAGARFTAVNNSTGDTVYIGPTDSSGYACIEDIPLGTYVVTETVFPEGYTDNGTTSWTVTIDESTPNGVVTVNAVNRLATGDVVITKTTNTGESLAGWRFLLTDADGNTCGPCRTDKNGTVTLSGLQPGTYTVTELRDTIRINSITYNPQAAQGESYCISIDAESAAGEALTYTWYRGYVGPAGVSYSQTGDTGSSVTASSTVLDAKWYCVIADESGNSITTDALTVRVTNGIITSCPRLVDSITYTPMTEIGERCSIALTPAAEGLTYKWYYRSTGQTAFSASSVTTDTCTFTQADKHQREMYAVVTDGSGSSWTTDTFSLNIFHDPAEWVYASARTVTVKAGGSASVSFSNTQLLEGSLELRKLVLGGLPGDVDGDGAVTEDDMYLLLAAMMGGSDRIDMKTADANGDGTVDPDDLDVINDHWNGITSIAPELLAGWVLDIYADAGCTDPVTTVTTDDFGQARITLRAGTYYVRERAIQDDGWLCDSTVYEVTVTASQTVTVRIRNTRQEIVPATGGIGVRKVSGTGDPLAGAVFGVYTDEGCTDCVGSIVTDQNGEAVLEELPVNTTCYVKENQAPEGYLSDETVWPVTIAAGEITWINGGAPVVNLPLIYVTDRSFTLPASGDGGRYFVSAMGAAGVLLTVAFIIFRRRSAE